MHENFNWYFTINEHQNTYIKKKSRGKEKISNGKNQKPGQSWHKKPWKINQMKKMT